jgi:hypothetical protein
MARRFVQPTIDPATGEARSVPSPDHARGPLPVEGDEVDFNPYWGRREEDGDVRLMAPEEIEALLAKRQAEEQAGAALDEARIELAPVETLVQVGDTPAPDAVIVDPPVETPEVEAPKVETPAAPAHKTPRRVKTPQ